MILARPLYGKLGLKRLKNAPIMAALHLFRA